MRRCEQHRNSPLPERSCQAVEAARLLAPSLFARADAALAEPDEARSAADPAVAARRHGGLGSSWLADNVGTVVIGPEQAVA